MTIPTFNRLHRIVLAQLWELKRDGYPMTQAYRDLLVSWDYVTDNLVISYEYRKVLSQAWRRFTLNGGLR